MGTLRVVRAGAGSGKTHDLCEHIAERVAAGLDPARLLATTFTRKAAAELKGRIQARLLTHTGLSPGDRLVKAERLELAAIGTVHSVGKQLLTRYALPLGLSPRLTVLEEAGSAHALRDLLARMDPRPWEDLAQIGRRFSLDPPQDLALKLLDAKRSNNISDPAFRAQVEASGRRLCKLMAPEGPRAQACTFEALYALARRTLAGLERIADGVKKTEEAKTALRRLLARQSLAWRDFVEAGRKIEAGKRSGADALLEDLRRAAGTMLGSPDLHRDVRDLLSLLASQTLALATAYADFKRERGLLDFTDLEVWLLRLLNTPVLAASLQADLDLVVVDEFHDTNPLQLAIFQRLRALVPSSRWVGDAKQSIYGFRGADPELIHAVWNAVPEAHRERLPRNYRSQAGLVQLVGRLFQPVFGDEAVLEPDRPGASRGVERWVIKATNKEDEYTALAVGIAQLRDQGCSLRSIAILARTNDDAKAIGEACRVLGIPALLELPGLLSTREGALTLAGLRLVADRYDSLAAATIIHLLGDPQEETPSWLALRLRSLSDDRGHDGDEGGHEGALRPPPWAGDPYLRRLEGIDHRTLPPSVIVQRVIEALEAGNHLRTWGGVAKRAANLDTFVTTALEYEQGVRELGSAATLSGLITHLEGLAAEGTDATRPPYGIDAVSILTYHGSKGLEWSVVVLTSLDFTPSPDMWRPVVTGGEAGGEDPLAGRALRYWPWPFGGLQKTSIMGSPDLQEVALASPEGQEAMRRGEAESLRLLYVGFTRARDKVVLVHRDGSYAWLEGLPDIDALLPPGGQPGERPLEGIETTYVLRRLDASMAEQYTTPPPAQETWLVPLRAPGEAPGLVARYHNPSQEEAGAQASVTVERLPGAAIFPARMDEAQEGVLGNAVHAYLGALPSVKGLQENQRHQVALRCLKGSGAEKLLSAADLVAMGERLRAWVEARCPGATWHSEVPVTAPRATGGQWNGVIDLLLRLPSGEVVVVDHKSSPIRADHCADKAASFAGQVAAYREALMAQGLAVREAWIHFPLAAVMANVV
jgi:ATP-dependent exoDNAse (exonuclease V) beta subunit